MEAELAQWVTLGGGIVATATGLWARGRAADRQLVIWRTNIERDIQDLERRVTEAHAGDEKRESIHADFRGEVRTALREISDRLARIEARQE